MPNTFIDAAGCVPIDATRLSLITPNEPDNIGKGTHRTAPNIKLLDRRRANGSAGSEIRLHSPVISAVITDRLGSFLNADFDPSVAASLDANRSFKKRVEKKDVAYQSRPNPLSRFARSSGVKNMARVGGRPPSNSGIQ